MITPAFSIYNASAGSGKTYTLVKEYLKIILTSPKNDAYKNILAITFTNKAVHEMKSRIVDSLFDFTKENVSDKTMQLIQDIALETQLSQEQIIKKAKLIIKSIIHNYAAFDISTIDKFTHKVIRAFALDLNLPISFEVSLDTERLLQEAVDAIVAQAGEDDVLTKLLIDFTLQKTQEDKSWDISTEIFSTGKLLLNENSREEILALKDKTIPEFLELKNKLIAINQQIDADNTALASQALVLLEQKGIDLKSFSRATFPNHLKAIVDKKYNPQNATFRTEEDIKINKTATDTDAIQACVPELLGLLQIVYTNFEKKAFYEAFLKNITPLSLLNKVSNTLQELQEEQNILSISEFNKLINEQIQNQPAPFIYERLGEKYKHFFIDEFQDTSQMQWQNLIPLIDNALSSQDLQGVKGSLMLVGDPKQSIYRWRGGKAEQFIDLVNGNNPFSNKDQKIFDLATNYRSYAEVIQFNNAFFKFLSDKFENPEYKDLYFNKSTQLTNNKNGGFVQLSFLPKTEDIDPETDQEITNQDLYLSKTLQIITQVQSQGFCLKDIVLLTRSNKQGVWLANYLTEQDIPVISSESLLLNASSEVQFVLYMLRYLNDTTDKESLAYVLYYLAKNKPVTIPEHDFIWQGISFGNTLDLEKWLLEYDIKLPFSKIKKRSLYEAVEMLVHNAVPVSKNNAYVQFFLDVVLERDVKQQLSISDFLDYWERAGVKLSIPSAEGTNAIRIMTIHKSKGLEFPVVIFPFAEENFSVYKREKMWLDAPEESQDWNKFLIDKSSKVLNYGENAVSVYTQKAQEDLLDTINVLYVALTRAKEQLYIISSYQERNKQGNLPNNLASFFIEFLEQTQKADFSVLEYNFGNPVKKSTPTATENTTQNIKTLTTVLPLSAIKIAQKEALMWDTPQQEAITFGNVLHKILSYVLHKNDIDLAIQKAIESGIITPQQKDKVYGLLQQIVSNDALQDFFNPKSTIYNEQSILCKGTKILIPDRVVVQNNNAYLLDYKTGTPQQKYTVQLQEYAQALETMGFRVCKKTLLYIGTTIEIVNL